MAATHPMARGRPDTMPGMTCGMWQMRPLSRGYVEARSPRPEEQPNINPRYFSERPTAAPRWRAAVDPQAVRRAGVGEIRRGGDGARQAT